MVRTAIIGLGKMGISQLAILGAHPEVDVVGVCDTSKLVISALEKYSSFSCYCDYVKMLDEQKPEAVFVSVPTKLHYDIVKALLKRNIHVFTEKPFCMNPTESKELTNLALELGLINQVGYHNKFIGTFQEVKKIVQSGALGKVYHFIGESYGPVVVKPQETWRSTHSEGGGCLMDYASHVIDLINDILSPVVASKGTVMKSIHSTHVEDAVYSLLELRSGISGVLSVNWSDETYRKMSTSVTIIGTKGKIVSDANELKVHFSSNVVPPNYNSGWNVKYVTDLTAGVDFYLRGEEYSAQIDYFVGACQRKNANEINNFLSALHTDQAIAIIKNSLNQI